MRPLSAALVLGMLVGGALLGCAMSPEQREATIRAWAERDAERRRECAQVGGIWAAGGCVSGRWP